MLTDEEIAAEFERARSEYFLKYSTLLGVANSPPIMVYAMRHILDADLKARQAAMVKGINLLALFNKAVRKSGIPVDQINDAARISFMYSVIQQLADFLTTPSTGPLPTVERLTKLHDAEAREFTERECFVAEHMLQLGFETLDDNATVYGCTLSQVLALLEAHSVPTATPELVEWDAICEGKKYLGLIESDVINVGLLIESVAKLREASVTAPEQPVAVAEPTEAPQHRVQSKRVASTSSRLYCAIRFDDGTASLSCTYAARPDGLMIVGDGTLQNPLDIVRVSPAEQADVDIKISRHGVAVDQNYRWNYDMGACPGSKVQLLGANGLPSYGHKTDPGHWVGWAGLPKA